MNLFLPITGLIAAMQCILYKCMQENGIYCPTHVCAHNTYCIQYVSITYYCEAVAAAQKSAAKYVDKAYKFCLATKEIFRGLITSYVSLVWIRCADKALDICTSLMHIFQAL